jgi:hypothetical protein
MHKVKRVSISLGGLAVRVLAIGPNVLGFNHAKVCNHMLVKIKLAVQQYTEIFNTMGACYQIIT